MSLTVVAGLMIGFAVFSAAPASAQCPISTTPTNNCTYGDAIDAFTLNAVDSVGNAGCSPSGYGFFATPVRELPKGQTYNWSATTGGGLYDQGVRIWIDLNNDGFFDSTESVASSPPGLTHSGTLTIPVTAVTADGVRMRVMCAYNTTPTDAQACTSNIGNYGETEDYDVNIKDEIPVELMIFTVE